MATEAEAVQQEKCATVQPHEERHVAAEDRRAILYIVSRFPRISETFIAREWLSLADRFRLGMVSLMKGDRGLAHPETERLRPHVVYTPVFAARTLAANLRYVVIRPRAYLRTLSTIVRGGYDLAGGGAVKGVVVFWKSARIARIVEREGYDHVHAHFAHHPATAAFAVHRLTGVPFSFTVHGSDLFVDPALLAEKVQEAAVTVSVSRYNRDYIRASVPNGGRIEVVRCGVDLHDFPFSPKMTVRHLLSVSRLFPLKGHRSLVEAFADALKEEPELTLTIVGDGPEAEPLAELSRQLGIESRVHLRGRLTTPEVRRELASADLFALPVCVRPEGSIREGRMDGLPVSLIEAMASGLPVVTTPVSGIPELVVHEQTGLLVEPDDPKDLSRAIVRLARDPDLAMELARNARRRIEESFDLAQQTAALAALLDDVAGVVPNSGTGARSVVLDEASAALSSGR